MITKKSQEHFNSHGFFCQCAVIRKLSWQCQYFDLWVLVKSGNGYLLNLGIRWIFSQKCRKMILSKYQILVIDISGARFSSCLTVWSSAIFHKLLFGGGFLINWNAWKNVLQLRFGEQASELKGHRQIGAWLCNPECLRAQRERLYRVTSFSIKSKN